jgi:hypothetical protein
MKGIVIETQLELQVHLVYLFLDDIVAVRATVYMAMNDRYVNRI